MNLFLLPPRLLRMLIYALSQSFRDDSLKLTEMLVSRLRIILSLASFSSAHLAPDISMSTNNLLILQIWASDFEQILRPSQN